MTSIRLVLVLMGAAVAFACVGPRAERQTLDPIQLATAQQKEGQILFMRFCHSCHPDGAAGLGPSIIGMRAPDFLRRAQVRTGLGDMPAFHEDLIRDHELDAIIAYLDHVEERG